MQATSPYVYRSLFWPALLIGLGILWLLANLGALPGANLDVLLQLWPLVVVAAGLDLIYGRRSPETGGLIALGTLTLMLLFMWLGPALGLARASEVRTERFVEPLGEATSARVELNLSSAPSDIAALGEANDLIEAELRHAGEIDFAVSGTERKTVSLRQTGSGPRFGFFFFTARDLRWTIGLSPEVPLDLVVNVRSGAASLTLEELRLDRFVLEGGSGAATVSLPAGERYGAELRGTSGALRVDVPERTLVDLEARTGSGGMTLGIGRETDVTMTLHSGSGSVTVDVPEDAAVRLEVRARGSGSLNVPREMAQVSGDDRRGVWQTPGFDEAQTRIDLVVTNRGSGSITVR
jgi:hypothetical protein